MSLNKEFFNRETNITAKVVCDSVSPSGIRMTTFEIEYPRFIHSELMTHRALSKNSSSSRAIPIKKMLDQIESNMAVPVYWGKSKSGMQATEEVNHEDIWWYLDKWKFSFHEVSYRVKQMSDLLEDKKGFMSALHKQIPNRLTEPFQMMKVVISGTDWSNFFNLRIHPDSQPEICMLAYKMYVAMQESKPVELKECDWHLPYVNIGWNGRGELCYADDTYEFFDLEDAIKYSAACCASVSYRTEGMTLEKAKKIFDMLVKAEVVHASPFEHLATPMKQFKEIENSDYETVGFVNCNTRPESWQKGITHVDKHGQLYSGNLCGYIQYRHLLPNNTNWNFDFNERIKMFV